MLRTVRMLQQELMLQSPLLAARRFVVVATKCDLRPQRTLRKVDVLWQQLQQQQQQQAAQLKQQLEQHFDGLFTAQQQQQQHRDLARLLLQHLRLQKSVEVIPISAKEGLGLPRLVQMLQQQLHQQQEDGEILNLLQLLEWSLTTYDP